MYINPECQPLSKAEFAEAVERYEREQAAKQALEDYSDLKRASEAIRKDISGRRPFHSHKKLIALGQLAERKHAEGVISFNALTLLAGKREDGAIYYRCRYVNKRQQAKYFPPKAKAKAA